MLIYDKYKEEYYEVIPVKKIEEKIEEYRELLYIYKKKTEKRIEYVDKESMNCIIAQIQALQQLIKENWEVEGND